MNDQVAQAATHLTTFLRLYLCNDTDGARGTQGLQE